MLKDSFAYTFEKHLETGNSTFAEHENTGCIKLFIDSAQI